MEGRSHARAEQEVHDHGEHERGDELGVPSGDVRPHEFGPSCLLLGAGVSRDREDRHQGGADHEEHAVHADDEPRDGRLVEAVAGAGDERHDGVLRQHRHRLQGIAVHDDGDRIREVRCQRGQGEHPDRQPQPVSPKHEQQQVAQPRQVPLAEAAVPVSFVCTSTALGPRRFRGAAVDGPIPVVSVRGQQIHDPSSLP